MAGDAIDSEVNWNLFGPGREEFLPPGDRDPWIPVLIKLSQGTTPQSFARGPDFKAAAVPWSDWVLVPRLYTETLPRLGFEKPDDLRYIAALVKIGFFELLQDERNAELRDAVEDIALSAPLPPGVYSEPGEDEPILFPQGGPATGAVVVGIVDDGIAFAHERFREPGGSRVEFFWMQDGPPPGPPAIVGPLASGRELRKETIGARIGIDDLLKQGTYADLCDEDEVYRRAGVIDPRTPTGHKAILWRRAHGTHVLDLACGFSPESPPNWRIVGVQLPIATTGMPASSTLGSYIVLGLGYILVRSLAVANRLNCGPLPVVVNISYGITAGPHDGTHLVERAIEGLVLMWKQMFGVDVRVVIASGNSHLDRLHAEIAFASPGETVEIPWRVQPEDGTSSVVELWLPPRAKAGPPRVKLSVVAPGGGGTAILDEDAPPGQNRKDWVVDGAVLCSAYYDHMPSSSRGRFAVWIRPTARVDGAGPVAPAGLWTIKLENSSLKSGEAVHARIRRDEPPYGYPRRGRQSYFDDPVYERYDSAGRPVEEDNASIVKRVGSMNALATGEAPSVIGGVLRKELRPAPYSAGGPVTRRAGTAPAPRQGPDALAVCDDSAVHAGVLAAGTRSGSVVAMNGTSVAAPMITRWIAGELAAGKPGDRTAVRALAAAGEPRPAPAPPPPTPLRGGAGRIVPAPLNPLPRFER
jgi:hypothetical protein